MHKQKREITNLLSKHNHNKIIQKNINSTSKRINYNGFDNVYFMFYNIEYG